MWVKTTSGDLVNLANVGNVRLRAADSGSDKNYYVRADDWLLHKGQRASCQQALDDIEHGIINRAILVDLMHRESHGHTATDAAVVRDAKLELDAALRRDG